MNDVIQPSPELIEQARKNLHVPADWPYRQCEAGCGEVVFYPPDTERLANDKGVPLVIVCSAECALARYREDQ